VKSRVKIYWLYTYTVKRIILTTPNSARVYTRMSDENFYDVIGILCCQ